MTIIQDFGIGSLSEYIVLLGQAIEGGQDAGGSTVKSRGVFLIPERPKACPDCGAQECFWSKGCYFRWVIEGNQRERIAVPRYMCRVCSFLVSVLFAFLVPYRQFTTRAIGKAVQKYTLSETSYRTVAGELASVKDDSQRPDHSQVWRWEELFAVRSASVLNVVLQRACMMAGKEERLEGTDMTTCPNSAKAHTEAKKMRLDCGARALALTAILVGRSGNLVEALQTYFERFVENHLSIFAGRGIRLIAPQSSQPVIW